MIKIYKKINAPVVELAYPEPDCWINIHPPFNEGNLQQLSKELNIPDDFLMDSIDINEKSRYERDEEVKLIVFNTPIPNTEDNAIDSDSMYICIPVGIVLTADKIITISSFPNPLMEWFERTVVKDLNSSDRSKFVLKIMERNVAYFTHYLKEINRRIAEIEKELYNTTRNAELSKLLDIQKSLVYFVTDLRANELVMMKMQRTNFLGIRDDEAAEDLMEDIIIDNSQALEMAQVYTNILNGTMDTFGSIISNNLNQVLRILTSVTIVLMVPTLVASFYGMNVKLPLQGVEGAFPMVLGISLILSFIIVWLFMRKKWF
jgi:magnesium transporter